MTAPMPQPQDDAPTPGPRTPLTARLRYGVAGALTSATNAAVRRILPAQAAHSRPIPDSLTGGGQAAHNARVQQQLAHHAAHVNPPARKLPGLTSSHGQQQSQNGQQSQPGGMDDAQAQALTSTTFATQQAAMSQLNSLMQTNQAPQATPAAMYAPGAPLAVSQALVPPSGPRGWEYPIGYNVTPQPRSTEVTSNAQLRGLAAAYDGIRLCEQVYFDVLAGLELKIGFKDNVIPDGESEDDPKWRAISDPAAAFFAKPDGITPLNEWMTGPVRDVLELAHAFIYYERDRAGRILGLSALDPATIKPLLDERGRIPRPPYPAFEQWLYGVPAAYLRADQVEWLRETVRTDSIYSTSRVEALQTRINNALRKILLDLARYTDGVLPEGIFVPTAETGIGPDQWEQAERLFNALFAGNDAARMRLKFMPVPGTFTATRPADPQTDFDRYLLNLIVAGFGLTMDELGMTDTSNRSVGDSQQAVVYRRTVRPLAGRFAALFTRIAQREFDPRLVATWAGYEEQEDKLAKAQALDIGVKNGSLSPSRFARMMGWPVDLEVPPMVVTKDGPIWLEDALALRQAQHDAKLSALEFLIGAPGSGQEPGGAPGTPGGDDGDTPPSPPDAPQPSGTPSGNAPAAPASGTPPKKGPPATAPAATPKPQQRADGDGDADVVMCCHADGPETPCDEECDCGPECACRMPRTVAPNVAETSEATEAERSAEYRRWYTVATRAVKAGRVVPSFTSAVLPARDVAPLADDLTLAATLDDVRAAFTRARQRAAAATPLAHATPAHETVTRPAGKYAHAPDPAHPVPPEPPAVGSAQRPTPVRRLTPEQVAHLAHTAPHAAGGSIRQRQTAAAHAAHELTSATAGIFEGAAHHGYHGTQAHAREQYATG